MHIQIYIYIYTYIHIYIYLTIAKCCYIATCIVFCTKYLYLRLFSFAKISLARKKKDTAEEERQILSGSTDRIVQHHLHRNHRRIILKALVFNCYHLRPVLACVLATRIFPA